MNLCLNKTAFIIGLLALVNPVIVFPQERYDPLRIREADLNSVLQELASPVYEGRETGTPGSQRAAEFIATRIQQCGLLPFFRQEKGHNEHLSDYYQGFKLIRYTPVEASMLISDTPQGNTLQLKIPDDCAVETAYGDLKGGYSMVFAGYGIYLPEMGYNSYEGLDVAGKAVLLRQGYPGENDTLGETWKTFRSIAGDDAFDLDRRLSVAYNLGASMVLVMEDGFKSGDKAGEPVAGSCDRDLLYQDAEYFLPGLKPWFGAPSFYLTSEASHKLSEILFNDSPDFSNDPKSYLLDAERNILTINLAVQVDTLEVFNVGGMMKGTDTTHTIIIGAHYDHLGRRGEQIYYGADDNASGVTGVLTLAQLYSASGIKPPMNIAFVCWTAEEKGLLGSRSFTASLGNDHPVALYINMDMISRSAPEDTSGKMISIGTRETDEYLRNIAIQQNRETEAHLILDLWKVDGYSGSDYGSFIAYDIPVMTFFSGFHPDYHTPCDIPGRADLKKMASILRLINACLNQYLEKEY